MAPRSASEKVHPQKSPLSLMVPKKIFLFAAHLIVPLLVHILFYYLIYNRLELYSRWTVQGDLKKKQIKVFLWSG
jgi:hypothetical protein